MLIVWRDKPPRESELKVRKTRSGQMRGQRSGSPKVDYRSGVGAALILFGCALSGCSIPVADLPVIGLPAGAPARPADPAAYPAVHDMPAARTEPILDPADQAKIETDLIHARDRQAAAAGNPPKPQNQNKPTDQ